MSLGLGDSEGHAGLACWHTTRWQARWPYHGTLPGSRHSDKVVSRILTHCFESTWLIERFSPHHVLIPSNIGGHSKLDKRWTNDEEPRKKKELKSGKIGSKSAEFVVGSGSIVTFIHSLTEKKQHISVRARGSKLQSKCHLLLVDTKVTAIFWNWQADVCFVH